MGLNVLVAQQTSAAKLPVLFQRFQTEVRVLRVNEINITTENAFNYDHFGIESNHESNNNKGNNVLGIFTDS